MLRAGEQSTKDQEQRRYERAHARVQAIKGLYVHATAFVVINVALLALNVLVGGAWWFYWPLIGWGIGLGLHAFGVFGFGGGGPWGGEWEERKIQEMVDEERRRRR
jgi:fatty acid desaturase